MLIRIVPLGFHMWTGGIWLWLLKPFLNVSSLLSVGWIQPSPSALDTTQHRLQRPSTPSEGEEAALQTLLTTRNKYEVSPWCWVVSVQGSPGPDPCPRWLPDICVWAPIRQGLFSTSGRGVQIIRDLSISSSQSRVPESSTWVYLAPASLQGQVRVW